MSIEIVRRNYERLKSQMSLEIQRGATKRSAIFPEWAHGKVLLDAGDARQVVRGALHHDLGLASRGVYDSFQEMDDERLTTAQAFDRDGQPIFILVLQP